MSQSDTPTPITDRVTAFWHRDRNFGDQLTKLLFAHFGVVATYAPAGEAEIIGVGSILDRVPPSYAGAVLGAGFRCERSRTQFPRATLLAVRGRLTADRCGAPSDCRLGDLGLAVGRLLEERPVIRHTLAIVPHYVDQRHPLLRALALRYPDEVVVVDVRADPIRVIERLASSEYVVSSSLHGLIAADALGKPSRWLLLSNGVYGGGFKFRDYYSAFSKSCEPLSLTRDVKLSSLLSATNPPESIFAERGDMLYEALAYFSRTCLQSRPGG